MAVAKTKRKISRVKKETLPIGERAQAYMKENLALLERHGLKARFVVSNRKKPGVIFKLALWMLRRTGSFVDIEFSSSVK